MRVVFHRRHARCYYCSYIGDALTPHRGQLVCNYHKEWVARLNHCLVMPEALSLWNVELTSVQFLSDEKLVSKED
ncbi:hypothetical protein VNO78_10755 [Psophocarpus tetragonolobus]|uniref:Uncharacterized protein n=1 Tax=Psophocarpus tetragonolobus TaxID=3891 RepID=A0AAN9SMN6_PSOTE